MNRLPVIYACVAFAAACGAEELRAQTLPARTVTPSTRYHAGPLKQKVMGTNWRAVWAAPIKVPVLDLGKFAGGLKPTKRGGNQSETLRLAGRDGKTYIFRSMDKFINKALNDDLKNTMAGDAIQDQTSAMHPTAVLVSARLEEKAGLLHARPQLVVMPDDPRLGEFRATFANMVGSIEERPDESESGQRLFGGADKIVATDKFVADVEESLMHRLDSREYLKARLMDFIMGDTDRGADQWRWARYDRGDWHIFRPIPRDHDYAFMRPTGLLAAATKVAFHKLVIYGNEFPSISALTFMTRDFDRTHLADLPRAAWDSVVADVQKRLTDDVIVDAVNLLPPDHRAISGDLILMGLKARRAQLPLVAEEYYALVNHEADVFGSEENELAFIDRYADGSVLVSLSRESAKASTDDSDNHAVGATVWQRRFRPSETEEVRVYLQGGNDRAVVRGPGPGRIKVRVTGGAGDDVLMDSSAAGAGRNVFYDATGKNRFVAGENTRIDEKTYVTLQPIDEEGDADKDKKPKKPEIAEERRGRFQDEAERKSKNFIMAKISNAFQRTDGGVTAWRPAFDFQAGAGLVVGAGPRHRGYGFRHVPLEYLFSVTPLIATGTGGVGMEAYLEVHPENTIRSYSVSARGTTFEAIRFNGFGNDSPRLDREESLIFRNELRIEPAVNWALSSVSTLSVGPALVYTNPRPDVNSPAWDVRSQAGVGQLGARADVAVGLHEDDILVRKGTRLVAGASGYPAIWDVDSPFGEVHAMGIVYVPVGKPVLALRGGGKRVWGDDFPLHEAAFLGGRRTLRGFQFDRFTGDTEAHGSAELRVPLGRLELLTRGDVGVLAFTDIGRVWFEGESPGGWHDSQGAGVWFSTLGTAFTLTYARGDQSRFYIQFGLPY